MCIHITTTTSLLPSTRISFLPYSLPFYSFNFAAIPYIAWHTILSLSNYWESLSIRGRRQWWTGVAGWLRYEGQDWKITLLWRIIFWLFLRSTHASWTFPYFPESQNPFGTLYKAWWMSRLRGVVVYKLYFKRMVASGTRKGRRERRKGPTVCTDLWGKR